MNKWLPTLALVLGGVVDKLSPAVNDFLTQWALTHKSAAAVIALGLGYVLHLLPSPLAPTTDTKQLGSALKMFALIGIALALSVPAHAQNKYEVGVLFSPSARPRFQGAASFLVPVDSTNSTYSYSSALFNKPINGSVTYSVVTGIRRKSPLQPIPWGFTLWLDAQGGPAIGGSAVSGNFIGGGALTKQIKNVMTVYTGKAYVSPVNGGTTVQVTAGAQF